MTQLYAQIGETVTCEAGHVICTVARDIPLGELFSWSFFTDWHPKQRKPLLGDSVPACRCGRPFLSAPGVGPWRGHFLEGWRTPFIVSPPTRPEPSPDQWD